MMLTTNNITQLNLNTNNNPSNNMNNGNPNIDLKNKIEQTFSNTKSKLS